MESNEKVRSGMLVHLLFTPTSIGSFVENAVYQAKPI